MESSAPPADGVFPKTDAAFWMMNMTGRVCGRRSANTLPERQDVGCWRDTDIGRTGIAEGFRDPSVLLR